MFGTGTFGMTFLTSFTLGMFDPSALPHTCTPCAFTQPSTSALARGGNEMEAASMWVWKALGRFKTPLAVGLLTGHGHAAAFLEVAQRLSDARELILHLRIGVEVAIRFFGNHFLIHALEISEEFVDAFVS